MLTTQGKRRNMEKSNFSQFLRSLRDRRHMSLRDVEKESGISNAYISQMEKGDRPPPRPDMLRKLARVYNVTVRELLLKAGYLDEPEVTATDEERIEAAFQYALADPDYKLGTRIRGEDLDVEGKRGVVITYETLTGKRILTI
jgi:HTH-type transcriptional regulator, competence development regulator